MSPRQRKPCVVRMTLIEPLPRGGRGTRGSQPALCWPTSLAVTAAHDRTHGTDLLDAVNGWVVVGDCDEMGVQTSVR